MYRWIYLEYLWSRYVQMYPEYLGSVWGWQMASAGDATQEGAHSQSQGGSPGEGRYQSRQDCQHVHLSVYLSTHIKCRLMTARFQSFVHYQYPSSKNWLIRAEEKLDISRLIFSICLHCGVAKNCTDLNTRYQLQQRTSSLNTQAGLTLFMVWSTEIDQDWPDSRSKRFWAGYY